MINPYKLLIIVSLITTQNLFAQVPETLWTKVFTAGSYAYNEGNCVQQTLDSGYIVTGYTQSSINATDVFLIKTDQNGDSLWGKKYNENNGVGNSVIQTSDHGYIIVGNNTRPSDGMTDLVLIKTDSIGDVNWRKVYGLSNQRDVGFQVRQTTDNGYIISGGTSSQSSGHYGIWLIKTNENGDSIWTRTYCGSQNVEEYASVEQTNDGGYIIVGSIYNTDLDICLIKTNEYGDTVWTKTFGDSGSDYGRSVQQTKDGGYILVGDDGNILLIKTNEFGDTLWTRSFNIDTDLGRSVIQTIDGGYLVCGFTYSNTTYNTDAWLIRTDENGNTQWTELFGSPLDEIAYSAQQTIDNGYIFTGSRRFTGSSVSYIWLVKLGPDEVVNAEINVYDLKAFDISQNYPNPFNPTTKIEYSVSHPGFITLQVFDVLGNEIKTLVNEEKAAGRYNISFDGTSLASGIYFYVLRAGDFIKSRKMLLLK